MSLFLFDAAKIQKSLQFAQLFFVKSCDKWHWDSSPVFNQLTFRGAPVEQFLCSIFTAINKFIILKNPIISKTKMIRLNFNMIVYKLYFHIAPCFFGGLLNSMIFCLLSYK